MNFQDLFRYKILIEIGDFEKDLASSLCIIIDDKDNTIWSTGSSAIALLKDNIVIIKSKLQFSMCLINEFEDFYWSEFSSSPNLYLIAQKGTIHKAFFKALSKNLFNLSSSIHHLITIDNHNNIFSDLKRLSEMFTTKHYDDPKLIINSFRDSFNQSSLGNMKLNIIGIALYLNQSKEIKAGDILPDPKYYEYSLAAYSPFISNSKGPNQRIKLKDNASNIDIITEIGIAKEVFIVPIYSPLGKLILLRDDETPIGSLTSLFLDIYINTFLINLFPSIASILVARNIIADLSLSLFDSILTSSVYIEILRDHLSKNDLSKAELNILDLMNEIKRMEVQVDQYISKIIPFPEISIYIDIQNLINDAIIENNLYDDNIKFDSYLEITKYLISFPINVKHFAMIKVIREILRNIIRYAYPNETKKDNRKVSISFINSDLWNTIIISDYGIGVNKEHLSDDIFSPGWKANNSSNGNGMGLAYAKYVIEKMHYGKLSASVTDGDKGLTMTIDLPSKA
jgi:signal transduction histidine kinase